MQEQRILELVDVTKDYAGNKGAGPVSFDLFSQERSTASWEKMARASRP